MADSKRQLIINYVAGEECRVAVMADGKLDEFHSEKAANVSHVGNIYVGRVTNVEPAIQAAFVDFGLGDNGFLHVSDLHPRYFPGEGDEATERVGKKTPRRERPPIQDALRRGQEIIVQVLKEGVGSKGPTVTSYLSIPGRYLVMMPQMDRVGVSRKVEDEDLRRKMVAILDQLDLPDGFGFILRTAGLERNKTELKRDLAYLLRLNKDMERRRKAGNKPRLLYSESDLLVRALRDMLTAETESVIIDSEAAIKRAAHFMKIVAPRTVTKLVHYKGHTPIFHALGVEDQIRTIYAREVPLPSGGRLVIDETEALVAIDVNSGKSRSAGDSDINAYKTNLEAVEVIARQLRLRDLGGIVVNDLIDMRLSKHRKEVEGKFEEILKSDRARTSVAPISEFGILEMTRQRMRGSHESQHFLTCATCHGRGLVQKPESVAADAIRELAALLDQPKVARAELVVNPRIGSELLSTKRKALSHLERVSGKNVSVRLSDAIPPDRVTFYAYDATGSDLDVDRLPKFKVTDDMLVRYEEPGVTDAPEEQDEGWATEPEKEVFVDDVEPVEAIEENRELHPIEMPLGGDDDLNGPITPLGGRPAGRQGGGGSCGGGGGRGPAPAEGEVGPDGERRGGRRRRGRRGGRGRGRGGDRPEGGEHREGGAPRLPGDTTPHTQPSPNAVPHAESAEGVTHPVGVPRDPRPFGYGEGWDKDLPPEGVLPVQAAGSTGEEHGARMVNEPDHHAGSPTSDRSDRNDQPDQPMGEGEQGEGGGRRRRRRRRGGRGRGGGGGGEGGGGPQQSFAPGMAGPQGGQQAPRAPQGNPPSGPQGHQGGQPPRPPQNQPMHNRGDGHRDQRGGGRPPMGQHQGGRPAQHGAPGTPSLAAAFRAEPSGPTGSPVVPPHGTGEPPHGNETGHDGPPGAPMGEGEHGEHGEGGGRRRRRRRGGRGRGGGGGGGGGGGEINQGQGGGPPVGGAPQGGGFAPQQRRDGGRPQQQGGGAPSQGGTPRPSGAPNSAGTPFSTGGSSFGAPPNPGAAPGPSGAPGAPKPRKLYAFNRRLKPGEAGKIKRDE